MTSKHIDVFSPLVAFSGLYLLYGISGYLFNRDFGIDNHHSVYITSNILGLISFIFAYIFVDLVLKRVKGVISPRINYRALIFVLSVFFILYTIVEPETLIDFITFNPLPYTESALRADRSGGSGPKGFLNEIYIHSFIFLLVLPQVVNRKVMVIPSLILLFYIVFTFKSGSKGPFIFVFLLGALNYHYNVRKVRPELLLGVVVILIPVFSIFSHVRYVSDLGQMFDIGFKLALENPRLILPVSFGEFTGPPQTLYSVIEYIESGGGYNLGSRWFEEILVFIPYGIFPDRPLPSSELFMEIFMPNAPAGSGVGWYIVTDGYWALGYLGVIFLMGVYGAGLALIHWLYKRNRTHLLFMIGYPYLYFILIITSIRTGFFGSLKVTFMYICFLGFLYLSSMVLSGFRVRRVA